MRLAKGKMQGEFHWVYGGPWNGEKILIPNQGTMLFRLGKWYGHYTGLGVWINGQS